VTNAAMIAAAALPKFLAGKFVGWIGAPRGEILTPYLFVRGLFTPSIIGDAYLGDDRALRTGSGPLR